MEELGFASLSFPFSQCLVMVYFFFLPFDLTERSLYVGIVRACVVFSLAGCCDGAFLR